MEVVVRDLREKVEATTGVQVSVGIGHSLLTARLATKAAKPNNFHSLASSPPLALQTYMAGLPVSEIPGIGWHGQHRLLEEAKVSTCGELQGLSRDRLQSLFGPKQGVTLYDACRGVDHRPIVPVTTADGHPTQQSIAVNINYGVRFEREDHVRSFLHDLAGELLDRLASTHLTAHLLSLKLMIRHPNAPIEPPRKFLGHGVCEMRSKSKAIEGRGLGEGGAGEAEKERLTAIVVELWEKLKGEFKIKVEDLRGVGLQFNRLKPRLSSTSKSGPFSAWKIQAPVVEAKVEVKEVLQEEGGWPMEEGEEVNDWREEGMEEEMEMEMDEVEPVKSPYANRPPLLIPPAVDESVSAGRSGTATSPARPSFGEGPFTAAAHSSSAPAAVVITRDSSLDTSTKEVPSSVLTLVPAPTSSTAATASSPSFTVPASLLSGGAFTSAGVLGTATVQLSMDQLLHVLTTLQQQQQQAQSHPVATTAPPAIITSSNHPSTTASTSTLSAAQPQSSAPLTLPSVSSSSPSLDAVVSAVNSAKERAFLESLPAFSSLDRSVISALPFDLRQELASAYKMKRAMEREGEEAVRQHRPSPPSTTNSPHVIPHHTTAPPAVSSAGRSALPSFTAPSSSLASLPAEVDPNFLAALPPDIRAEVELDLRRQQRIAGNQTSHNSATAISSSTTAAKAGRGGKRTAKRKQRPAERPTASSAAIGAAPLPHSRGGLQGVSIVSRFNAEEERKVASARASHENSEDVVVINQAPRQPMQWPPPSRVDVEVLDSSQPLLTTEELERKYDEDEPPQRLVERGDPQHPRGEEGAGQNRRTNGMGVEQASYRTFTSSPLDHQSRSHAQSIRARAPHPIQPPLVSAALHAAGAPLSSEAVADALTAASATFLSFSSLEPHFSQWLRTLRRCAPHMHSSLASSHPCCTAHPPNQGCTCSPHCFCPSSLPHLSLRRLLTSQLALRNLECTSQLLKALSGVGTERNGNRKVEELTAPDCVCFDCGVKRLVEGVRGLTAAEYGGVVKLRGSNTPPAHATSSTALLSVS